MVFHNQTHNGASQNAGLARCLGSHRLHISSCLTATLLSVVFKKLNSGDKTMTSSSKHRRYQLAEILRENKRMLDKAIRELDRENF